MFVARFSGISLKYHATDVLGRVCTSHLAVPRLNAGILEDGRELLVHFPISCSHKISTWLSISTLKDGHVWRKDSNMNIVIRALAITNVTFHGDENDGVMRMRMR